MFAPAANIAFQSFYPKVQPPALQEVDTRNSHTLFIKNLSFDLSYEEFLRIFEQYGAIATCYPQIKDRGLALIVYYDSRSAKSAVENLQNLIIKGRRAIVDFAVRIPNEVRVDPFLINPLVIFTPFYIHQPYDKNKLAKSLETFGVVQSIKESPTLSFNVSFFDSRYAKSLIQNGPTVNVNGVNFDIKCENYVLNNSFQNVYYNPNYQQIQNPSLQNIPPSNNYNNMYPSSVVKQPYPPQFQFNSVTPIKNVPQMSQEKKNALEAALQKIAQLT
ncbi:protein MEI2-like 3 [Histomonas meleagridis]|uniref:protein MEI2-like 3 n=1 Tax=Histomonas meleagridis TaxID=135588 RepID=UPI00355A7E23|nr:protein MEI2-like 3 [Histomonas meleagridis]KAH0798809.1 protein MEI2-like 3 [Histomonas meleagridis]